MSVNGRPALHELRRANEARRQEVLTQRIGLAIGVGLNALGAWALWEHNLFLAIPFMVILIVDVVKARKEGFLLSALFFVYGAGMVIGAWNHNAVMVFSVFVLFAVIYFLEKSKEKRRK